MAYDDEGRRLRKVLGASAAQYLYNGPDIVAEYDSTWLTPTARTTHGPGVDEPLLRTTATATQYYHHDGLGSIVALSNASGGTDATARYDAWGNTLGGSGTIPSYGYTGREPDETGLIYYRARYYDPTLGRFTQRDPIGLAGGINPYTYVENSPTNYIDPDGQLIQVPIGAAIGAAAGGISAMMNGQNILLGVGIGAVTGAAASLGGPPLAAAANAIGNVAIQYLSGTTQFNLTSVALAAIGGAGGKLVAGTMGAALQGTGVGAVMAGRLAQVTTGLALTPNVAMAASLASKMVPVRITCEVSLDESGWSPSPPPSFDATALQWIMNASGQPRIAVTPDIMRDVPQLATGPVSAAGGSGPGATPDVLRDATLGSATWSNYTGGGSAGTTRPPK